MPTKEIIKPNTVLPKGARLLKKPVKLKIGGWVEMTYDAEITIYGLRWLRVQNGMGDGQHPGEDWVCDLPEGCISVHDYQWREPRWGFMVVNSFEEAVRENLKDSKRHATDKAKELRAEADRRYLAAKKIAMSIERFPS